ncbi:MAG: hypothetical protein FJ096_04110 [Deltaproteobacteria bacterium]|nr:hypothetical protein [Deltaproteobacteria bacterium]
MNFRQLFAALAMITFPAAALLPTTPAVADDADDAAAEIDDEAAAEDEVDDLSEDGSSCIDAVKECDAKFGLLKAVGSTRTACKDLRQCKRSCRGDAKAEKKRVKQASKSCKQECKAKKGKDRRACKKSCRDEKREAVKELRAGRKGCVTECRGKFLTPECKQARGGLLKATGECVKGLVKNKDCQEQAKDAFDSLTKAQDEG